MPRPCGKCCLWQSCLRSADDAQVHRSVSGPCGAEGASRMLLAQGMKTKMKDMASKLGLGGGANPFGSFGG